jgi:hypothetical protein
MLLVKSSVFLDQKHVLAGKKKPLGRGFLESLES